MRHKDRKKSTAPSASGRPTWVPFFTTSVPPAKSLPPSAGLALDLSLPPVFPNDIFRTKMPEYTPTRLMSRKGLVSLERGPPCTVPPPDDVPPPASTAEPVTAQDDADKPVPPTPPMLFSPTPDQSGYRRMMAKHVGYRYDGLYGILDFGEYPTCTEGHKTTVFYVNNVTYYDLPEMDLLFPAVKQEVDGTTGEMKQHDL